MPAFEQAQVRKLLTLECGEKSGSHITKVSLARSDHRTHRGSCLAVINLDNSTARPADHGLLAAATARMVFLTFWFATIAGSRVIRYAVW